MRPNQDKYEFVSNVTMVSIVLFDYRYIVHEKFLPRCHIDEL